MTDALAATRLFLITPASPDPATFPARLEAALGAGDVAAVLVEAGEKVAAGLIPIIQGVGAAALIADDTRIAGHVNADGVHVGTGIGDLRLAADSFRPKRIVGAGNLTSRHAAMEAGEVGVDYVFFGKPHGDTHDEPHPGAMDLAEWWSELMEIPAIIMAGRSLASVAAAAATGAAFVALNGAVWSHPDGPADAIRAAQAVLGNSRRDAA